MIALGFPFQRLSANVVLFYGFSSYSRCMSRPLQLRGELLPGILLHGWVLSQGPVSWIHCGFGWFLGLPREQSELGSFSRSLFEICVGSLVNQGRGLQ